MLQPRRPLTSGLSLSILSSKGAQGNDINLLELVENSVKPCMPAECLAQRRGSDSAGVSAALISAAAGVGFLMTFVVVMIIIGRWLGKSCL